MYSTTNYELEYMWTDLVGEFAVRVATEQSCADLGQQLLGDQLQASLQGVGDLKCGTQHFYIQPFKKICRLLPQL